MNHAGAGSMSAAATPPARNTAPIAQAQVALWPPATSQAANAPASVPRACARKGTAKCSGRNRWRPAARPSAVVMSTPAGGGASIGPAPTIAMLTRLPMTTPAITAAKLRNTCIIRPSPLLPDQAAGASLAGNARPSVHPAAHRSRAEALAEALALAVLLPVEGRRRLGLVADLRHVRGDVEQASVDHHVAGVGGMADVVERVA